MSGNPRCSACRRTLAGPTAIPLMCADCASQSVRTYTVERPEEELSCSYCGEYICTGLQVHLEFGRAFCSDRCADDWEYFP
jgi:ribosomal protein S27E